MQLADLSPWNGSVPEVTADVSLCFEEDPADCPSAATSPLHSVLAPVVLLAAAAGLAVAEVL